MNGRYDRKIDRYVPDGVTLTEVQQGYLTAVAELFEKQKTVRMADVAHLVESGVLLMPGKVGTEEQNCQLSTF